MSQSVSTTPSGSDATSQAAAEVADRASAPALSKEAANAQVDLWRFGLIVAQLAALLLVFWGYSVENESFLLLSICCFVGFAIHYFTPFRFKKLAFAGISLVGAFVVLAHPDYLLEAGPFDYLSAGLFLGVAIGLGLVFYVCLRVPVPFAVKVAALLAIGAGLAYARTATEILPDVYWTVLGAIFMFRLIIYAYDVKAAKKPEKLVDFFGYFFCLPSFYFPLFPVIDYTKFKTTLYSQNIHSTAQQGVHWMIRGTIHLCLYRLIYHRVVIGADEVRSLATLCQYVFPTYLLYLRVSGQFHIIAGMLHLFGYSLPRTNRNYLLADSFMDFWRRINIYWKDFMIKVFYYPTYFRFRKRSEMLALSLATVAVFITSCLLHSYQYFWLHGVFRLTLQDGIFWSLLGVFVLVGVVMQQRGGRPKTRTPAVAFLLRVVRIAAVYITISVIWSMWSSYSLAEWIDAVTYWR